MSEQDLVLVNFPFAGPDAAPNGSEIKCGGYSQALGWNTPASVYCDRRYFNRRRHGS